MSERDEHAGKHSVTCSVEGYGRPARAKGLCQRCTMRLRRTGDPMLTRSPKPGFRAAYIEQYAGKRRGWSVRSIDRIMRANWLLEQRHRVAPGVLDQLMQATGKNSIARYLELVELRQVVDYLDAARLAGRMRVMRSTEGMKALRLYVTRPVKPDVTECLPANSTECENRI